MYREIFEEIIGFKSLTSYPSLPCPYCGEKDLHIDIDTIQYKIVNYEDASKIIVQEREKSVSSIAETYKEDKFLGILYGIVEIAEKVSERPAKFVSFFECNNCEKTVSTTGTMKIHKNEDIETANIKVEYFSPPIPIIQLSANLPVEISEELIQAFNHFHSDLTSSGAKLRRAIEKMCLDLGYQQKNLHFAITDMSKDYPNEAQFLNSLKLVGNEATHADQIDENDLLDAFDVMDYVHRLYDRKKDLEVANMKALKLHDKFSKQVLLENK